MYAYEYIGIPPRGHGLKRPRALDIGPPATTLTGERLSRVYGVALAIETTGSGYRVVRPRP